MAWLSVGTSNEDLIQKMMENDVLHEGPILEAFRATDRGDFVNPEDRVQAYSDRPLKKGFIHLSAPHMYVTVLKALDLHAGKSFLNIGSGSGYLSCLAAYLLGEEGVSHGVEISEGACQFSREKSKEWHAKLSNRLAEESRSAKKTNGQQSDRSLISLDGLSFVNASCFDIDILNTVNTMKYDRIYVGAGCPEARKEFFLSMLADNGIMVVPINEKNKMLSIRKFYGRVYSMKPISNVNFAPLLDTAVRPDEASLLTELAALEGGVSLSGDIQQSIMKVQHGNTSTSSSFIIHPAPSQSSLVASDWQSGGSSPSSAVSSPASVQAAVPVPTAPSTVPAAATRNISAETVVRVRLPALVWAPVHKRHLQFPAEFRRMVFTILLANNRFQTSQAQLYRPLYAHSDPRACLMVPNTHQQGCRCGGVGASPSLPHQIWLLIFTFTSREWFTAPRSEVQALSMELAVERRLRRAAEDRLKRSEEARRLAEQERDVYRVALLRQKQHMNAGTVTGPGGIFWAMGGGEETEEDELEDEDEEEEEEEDEEIEWDEGDVEIESEGESDEESEEEGSESSEENEGMTVTDENEQEQEQEQGVAESEGEEQVMVELEQGEGQQVQVNSPFTTTSSSAGFEDVLEEPLTSAPAVLAEDTVPMMLEVEGEVLPTATVPSYTHATHNHHIWFHSGDSPLSPSSSSPPQNLQGPGAWQQHHLLQQASAAAPFATPITQCAAHCSHTDALSGAPFGSLSSDVTGTTVESNMSDSPPLFAGRRLNMHAAGPASSVSVPAVLCGSRPSSEERISDCTALSYEGEGEGEGDGYDSTDDQFQTDEL